MKIDNGGYDNADDDDDGGDDDDDDDDDGYDDDDGGVPGFPADAAVCSTSQTERLDQEGETCKGWPLSPQSLILL